MTLKLTCRREAYSARGKVLAPCRSLPSDAFVPILFKRRLPSL